MKNKMGIESDLVSDIEDFISNGNSLSGYLQMLRDKGVTEDEIEKIKNTYFEEKKKGTESNKLNAFINLDQEEESHRLTNAEIFKKYFYAIFTFGAIIFIFFSYFVFTKSVFNLILLFFVFVFVVMILSYLSMLIVDPRSHSLNNYLVFSIFTSINYMLFIVLGLNVPYALTDIIKLGVFIVFMHVIVALMTMHTKYLKKILFGITSSILMYLMLFFSSIFLNLNYVFYLIKNGFG